MDKEAMNHMIQPTKPLTKQVNDLAFRVILIPFFGIVIPLITGMTRNVSLTHWQFKLSFLYTILIAFVVWQGNRYLLFTLRTYFNWFRKPVRKIVALLLATSFYTLPVSALMLVGWYHFFAHGKVNWNVVYLATLLILICVIFITHVYETVFLVKESESEIWKNEQLERAKVQAELEVLKSQIDPHFLFNSLNTLSHLIEECPVKARQFNDSMADVYRYILQNKSRDLVLLQEEMDFLTGYFSLLTIRFEKAIGLDIAVPCSLCDQYLIPPISLQLLVENAIKHNEFSDMQPLVIELRVQDEELIVIHEIRKKPARKTSSRIGLRNLGERYNLVTGRDIQAGEENNTFVVKLPLLKIY
jgi:two-component system, LytTR family, sensor kinase